MKLRSLVPVSKMTVVTVVCVTIFAAILAAFHGENTHAAENIERSEPTNVATDGGTGTLKQLLAAITDLSNDLFGGYSPTTLAIPTQCVESPSGLVAWYRAENNVNDQTGVYNGSLEGSATYAGGKVGQAFSLSGASQGAAVTPEINVLDTYTIEFWIFPDGPQGSFRNLIWYRNQHPDGEFSGIYLRNTSNSYLTFGTINSATGSIPQNQWTHVAVTYSHPFETKMYLNGILAGSSSNLSNRLRAMLLFGNPPSSFPAMNGQIDEVSIYDRLCLKPRSKASWMRAATESAQEQRQLPQRQLQQIRQRRRRHLHRQLRAHRCQMQWRRGIRARGMQTTNSA
ncbi:MAG: LamG domain-containing protein [Acidobacteria bacterium]|nr:LamG domain-containing protein [Acidobacteriota bacterium]